MNFKTTGILVVVVVVVGAVWLFSPETEAPIAGVDDKPGATGPQFVFATQPERDDLVEVRIERPDDPALTFVRVEDDDAGAPAGMAEWRMTAPLEVPADGVQVSGLIRALSGLRSRAAFAVDDDAAPTPEEAGLAPPVAIVTLIDRDGKEYALEVGGKVTLSTDTYVRVVGEETIHVASRDLAQQVCKDMEEFRAKRFAHARFDDVQSIRVRHDGRTVQLTRSGDEWVIDAPIRARAVSEEVRTLFNRINGLRLSEFVDDAPRSLTPYGLEEPYLVCDVATERRAEVSVDPNVADPNSAPTVEVHRETFGILVGAVAGMDSDNRYVKPANAAWVATVRSSAIEDLVPDLSVLRDPQLVELYTSDVTRLELSSRDGSSVTLEQSGGYWSTVAGDLGELETAAIYELLTAANDLRAVSYIDDPEPLAEYGLDDPRTTMTITVRGQVEPVTLQIGGVTPSGHHAYVKRAGTPSVIVVSRAMAERLAVSPQTLRSRAIFRAPIDRVARVEIEQDGRRRVLTRVDDQWQLAEPEGAPLDAAHAIGLVNDLANLRAAEFVASDDPAAYGLDSPGITVTFTVAAAPATQPTDKTGPTVHALRVAEQDGHYYGRADDQRHVFAIDASVVETLQAELVDTRLVTRPANAITAIELTRPDETLSLAKIDGTWQYAPEPYLVLDQNEVETLATELAGLQARRCLEWQATDLAKYELDTPPIRATVTFADGSSRTVLVGPERATEVGRVATIADSGTVYEVGADVLSTLSSTLDELIQSEK